jgi:hypothetical protein
MRCVGSALHQVRPPLAPKSNLQNASPITNSHPPTLQVTLPTDIAWPQIRHQSSVTQVHISPGQPSRAGGLPPPAPAPDLPDTQPLIYPSNSPDALLLLFSQVCSTSSAGIPIADAASFIVTPTAGLDLSRDLFSEVGQETASSPFQTPLGFSSLNQSAYSTSYGDPAVNIHFSGVHQFRSHHVMSGQIR